MKAILVVVALLLIVSCVVQAQVPISMLKLWTDKTYAISQSDTSAGFALAGANLASLWLKYNDSVNVITLIQYQKDESGKYGTWTFLYGDTLDHTGGGVVSTNTYREVVLRSATVDRIGGVAGLVRVIQKFQATLCGVTTPKYRAWFTYRP